MEQYIDLNDIEAALGFPLSEKFITQTLGLAPRRHVAKPDDGIRSFGGYTEDYMRTARYKRDREREAIDNGPMPEWYRREYGIVVGRLQNYLNGRGIMTTPALADDEFFFEPTVKFEF